MKLFAMFDSILGIIYSCRRSESMQSKCPHLHANSFIPSGLIPPIHFQPTNSSGVNYIITSEMAVGELATGGEVFLSIPFCSPKRPHDSAEGTGAEEWGQSGFSRQSHLWVSQQTVPMVNKRTRYPVKTYGANGGWGKKIMVLPCCPPHEQEQPV